jgi:hypothetical protein
MYLMPRGVAGTLGPSLAHAMDKFRPGRYAAK